MSGRRNKSLGQGRGETFVFFTGLFHHPASDQILQFLVGAQAQHFLTTAGSVPGPKILVQDLKKLLELKGSTSGEHRYQFLSNEIRHTA